MKNLNHNRAVSFVLLYSAAFSGYAETCAEPPAAAVSYFEENIQDFFNEECVMCHMMGAANGELILEPGTAIKNLWNVPSSQTDLMRVLPGNAGDSYLLHKLRGTQADVGGEGENMPMSLPPLSEERLMHITKWIEQCS